MTAFRMSRRALHVGVALDEERLVASLPVGAGATTFERGLKPRGCADDTWPDLGDALAELRESCLDAGGASARDGTPTWKEACLHIALLPPLAHLRRVELRGLHANEALQVCRREPSRYLPVAQDSPSLELAIEGTGWWQASPFTLLAAHESLVEGIGAAAREGGWTVADIVPAEAAWAAGASSVLPGAAKGLGALVVPLADRVEIVGVRDARVAWLRRLPAHSRETAALVVSVLEDVASRAVVVLGATPVAADLRERLARTTSVTPDPGHESPREGPAELAARFVRGASGPALLPETEQRLRLVRERRASAARFAAAFVLLLAAGSVSAFGAARQAEAVTEQRERLRPAVAAARALRDSLASAEQRLATLRRAGAGAPRWSALITSLATVLPDDAFLVSMRADADSLRLEGSALEAAPVFEAVRRVRSLGSASPSGPIRQEVQADGAVRERFALAAPLERAP